MLLVASAIPSQRVLVAADQSLPGINQLRTGPELMTPVSGWSVDAYGLVGVASAGGYG